VHAIAVQSADRSLVVGDSHAYGDAVQPFARAEVDAMILHALGEMLELGAQPVIERWIGSYAYSPQHDVLLERPAPNVRLVLVTGGSGASTAFALGEEVVADLYLRRAEWDGARPPFGFAAARAAAAAAIANPDALLVPDPAEGYLLSRLAHGARKGLAERLQDANLLTYDHVLTRLAATLGDPARGAAACARLQQRYQVVLVDEFQDTDPVQWEVLRRAFGTGATTLVLIGDPKQAIYAFRGADVHAYLAAHRQARRFTLGANWRADQPLLDATDALLSPLQLGHPAIRFRHFL